jgi:hypothetical protein
MWVTPPPMLFGEQVIESLGYEIVQPRSIRSFLDPA